MKNIKVFDTSADLIKSICEEHDITEQELIESLLDVVRDEIIDLYEWL